MPQPFQSLNSWPITTTQGGGRTGRPWLWGHDLRRSSAFVDLDEWPPAPIDVPDEYVVSSDVLPDGRLVVCSMPNELSRPPKPEYAIRIHPPDWPRNPAARPAEVFAVPTGGTGEVHVIGDEILFWTSILHRENAEQRRAYRLVGDHFVPDEGLPEVERFEQVGVSWSQRHEQGKVRLGGRDVLVWDGAGYERQAGRWVRTWELGVRNNFTDSLRGIEYGPEAFFYLSDRNVTYVEAGAKPRRVLPNAAHVMHLSAGPEGSVIASGGHHEGGILDWVWFPAEGKYAALRAAHFGWRTRSVQLEWSATTSCVYVRHGRNVVTISGDELLAERRIRPRGDGFLIPRPA
jgi:hypothetical protein